MKKVIYLHFKIVIRFLLFACSFDFPPPIYHLQVGHAGTLDPMATGLLIVCIGKATKVVDW